MALKPRYTTWSAQEFIDRYRKGQLNLAPQFQRNSVWKQRDRDNLVDTMLRGMPVPAIFLAQLSDKAQTFDVVDGKQRIETLLAFAGHGRRLDGVPSAVRLSLDGGVKQWLEVGDLSPLQQRRLRAYRFPVVIVSTDGGAAEVVEFFVRLNSTGKRLTGMERRHARSGESPTLAFAQNLAADLLPRYQALGAISKTDQERMKHIELTLELLLSIERGDPLDKKKAIDKIIRPNSEGGDGGPSAADLRVAAQHLRGAIGDLEHVFLVRTKMSLAKSRFAGKSDFFSLVLFFALKRRDGVRLPVESARLIHGLLQGFEHEIAKAVEDARRGRAIRRGPAWNYLQTVKEGTDSIRNRRQRADILEQVIPGAVLRKLDPKRSFGPEQRRLLWLRSNMKCDCCEDELRFEQAHCDHIKPHIHGGMTTLSNGRVLCKSCNTRRGAGRPCFH